MLDIHERFATDPKLEVEGVKVDLGGGASMTVARSGNDRFVSRILEEGEKFKEVLDSGTPEAKELDRTITVKIIAETILVGFEGIGFKGKPMKYSVENAIKLLGIKDFRKRVIDESNKFENYRVKSEISEAKN